VSKFKKFLFRRLCIISFYIYLTSTYVSAQISHDHKGLNHWEIPSKNPDRIILTFLGNPATSRAVTWRTDNSIKNGVAQIAEATVNSNFIKNNYSL
jgi:hypothetical protein